MTTSEKDEQYGRAMRELKQARFDFAAAQKKLSGYLETLRETAAHIDNFSKNPTAKGPDQRPLADYAYGWQQSIRSGDLPELAHEVFTLARGIEKLEAELKAFE